METVNICHTGYNWNFYYCFYAGTELDARDPAVMALGRDGVSEVTPQLLENKRQELGLDRSGFIQYINWAKKAIKGDLGKSYVIIHRLAAKY